MRNRYKTVLLSLLLVLALTLVACGGGGDEEESDITPTATEDPNITPTLTETPSATFRPVFTLEPTATPTPTPTPTPTATPDPNLLREDGTIIIGTTEVIASLDPADAVSLHDLELLRNVNEGLLTFEAGTSVLVPAVAEDSPEVSEDGLTYTFTLAEGWAFPDGTAVVAQDFVRGVTRSLTLGGATASIVTDYVASVEAPDDSTVVFTLLEPIGYFPQVVTASAYYPVQAEQYPDNALEPAPEIVYGVGPYQITRYEPGVQTLFELNPNYGGTLPEGAPDVISVTYFADATQLALAIENNEIDIAWRSLESFDIARLDDLDGLEKYDSRGGGTRFLVINQDAEPFDEPAARQALALLVDRDEIVALTGQGQKEALYSLVPPGFASAVKPFLDIYGAAPDVAAAEALLTDLDFTVEEPLTFTLWYPEGAYDARTAQTVSLLEQQFEATPLVDVSVSSAPAEEYFAAALDGTYEIAYLGWFYTYPDARSYIEPFVQSVGDLLETAVVPTDQAERASLYEAVQVSHAENVGTIPLTFEIEFAVFGANIEEIIIGPTLDFNYEYIRLAE